MDRPPVPRIEERPGVFHRLPEADSQPPQECAAAHLLFCPALLRRASSRLGPSGLEPNPRLRQIAASQRQCDTEPYPSAEPAPGQIALGSIANFRRIGMWSFQSCYEHAATSAQQDGGG